MAVFPVLDLEEKLQLGDKTRMDGSKSFVSPAGDTALTTMTITPGLGAGAQNIFSTTTEDRYLDWIFNTWNVDIVSGYNDKIDFDQGGVKVATLTAATYTLADLLTHIAARLNAVVGISGTFSLASDVDDKITITNSTTAFQLLPLGDNKDTSLLPHIGYKKETATGVALQGDPVEYLQKKIVLSAGNGSSVDLTKYVKLYSVYGDSLFSTDQDLITWEPDIMKWVPRGRSSFINIHREAQEQILYWLDKEGYTNAFNRKFNKYDLVDVSEVNEWSAFITLSIIMWGISNKTDDVFLKKHFEYLNKSKEARGRAIIRLDVDEDGEVDLGEEVDIRFGTVVTR